MQTYAGNTHYYSIEWFRVSENTIFNIGIRIDKVTALMVLLVNFISFLVHLFSIEYIRGDKHFEKYFSYLGLFTFSMLGILLADNLLQIFIFWELVGLSSYLLIGFFFTKESASYSSKKAFIVNRVGDAGFLMAILIIIHFTNTLTITELPGLISNIPSPWLSLAGLGLFLGAMGKSAQFPLHVWLPNAMEGPTPVSALIHAATMVAAGIYLLFRINFIFTPDISLLITIIGLITSVIGAFSAISQTDIKKVLAFSTISQLGYMVMGMGVGAYDASLFHLITHAFFKACLFLSAGAVIHSMHHVKLEMKKNGVNVDFDPQDMRLMGGLRKRMPITFYAYMIATASLAGLPFFSGFMSKDAIITALFAWAETQNPIYYIIPITAIFTVLMTAFYMFRQVFMIYFHDFRLEKFHPQLAGAYEKVIETPWLMRIPIIILASLSLFFVFSYNPFDSNMGWMNSVVSANTFSTSQLNSWHYTVSISSVLAGLIGVAFSYYQFGRKDFVSEVIHTPMKERIFLTRLSFNSWYLDKIYNTTFVKPQLLLAKYFTWIDLHIIDKVINLISSMSIQQAKLITWLDHNIIDKLVLIAGYKQIIIAWFVEVFDKNIIDGLIKSLAESLKTIGRLINKLQSGNAQLYVASTLLLFIVLLYNILT